ncbi:DUF1028 domain-containing protein [Breoghania sp.]|uniref:DUF1028 domain-containing protein n=1 Tax=Breoghania sp. TaxID=2065378 RepID=UPI0026089961|nr:DUF1028 domain-containing protein [Breoghania sp.]MDJ0932050.1 DUF1028 domain-containing protein [Breoghania sp.]
MTYSIIGRDPETGEIGCAVQSKFPGVGSIVLHGRVFAGGEGAACLTTQAFSNPRHGDDGLTLMERGATPAEALAILTGDDDVCDERQIAAMTLTTPPAAFTGETAVSWEGAVGSCTGAHCVTTGNALASDCVLSDMVTAFGAVEGELTERLVAALRAGWDAGGELRGQQSAAVLVMKAGGGYDGSGVAHVDISVYDHAEPIE